MKPIKCAPPTEIFRLFCSVHSREELHKKIQSHNYSVSHDKLSVLLLFPHRKMYVMATEVASSGGTNPSKAITTTERFSDGHTWNGIEKPKKLIRKSKKCTWK